MTIARSEAVGIGTWQGWAGEFGACLVFGDAPAPPDLVATGQGVAVDESPRPRAVSAHLSMVGHVANLGVRRAPGLSIADLLAAWRAAERQLDSIPEGSPAWVECHATVVGFRAAYHQLVNERLDRPPRSGLRVAGWPPGPR